MTSDKKTIYKTIEGLDPTFNKWLREQPSRIKENSPVGEAGRAHYAALLQYDDEEEPDTIIKMQDKIRKTRRDWLNSMRKIQRKKGKGVGMAEM